jgi:hypothetical protein
MKKNWTAEGLVFPRMGFLSDLNNGALGLRLALPGRFAIQGEKKSSANLVDLDRKAALFLFHFDLQLDLRREHEGLLARDIERHTRELFETHFATVHSQQPSSGGASKGPRTADPAWSPVVSIERVQLGHCEALSVVHRMAYEHGLEIVMGHLLVPLHNGLFEFRVIAGNNGPTGVRESQLVAQAMAVAGVKTHAEAERVMKSTTPDDPRHDAHFPDHPLSVVRSMLRMLMAPGAINVTHPAPLPPSGEVVLPDIGCTLTPPPRYVQTPGSEGTFVRFSRVGFAGGRAGEDGVQMLTISSLAAEVIPEGPDRRQKLMSHAESLAQSLSERATGVRLEAWMSSEREEGAHALAHTEFQPGAQGVPRQRAIVRVFTDAKGVEKLVWLQASACVPREELLADMEAVIRSWRPLEGTGPTGPAPVSPLPAEKKKWWWF